MCWEIEDQYMFGDRYLVAPILELGCRKRQVYLPEGTWKNMVDGKEYLGGSYVVSEAPLEAIPVFERV